MKIIGKKLIFLCWLLPILAVAQSKDNMQVSLITIGPGQYYWSAFGHSALRVQTNSYDKIFGFGYFDFEQENFFLNFAKGEMQYFLGVNESQYELADYQQQGRKIISQRLDLSTSQKQQLIKKLLFLAREENRYYPYDYFLNNCTSRIRDLLDEVTHGEISRQLKPKQTHFGWSDLTFPASNQAWMNLGIAYIYGIPAFAKKNQWQLSVFPEVFSQDIQHLSTQTHWNTDYQVLFTPNNQALAQYHFLKTHYAVILLVAVLLLGISFKATSKTTAVLWLIIQSLLGIGLLLLWFFTKHSIAAWNINLLLFFPLAWLMLIKRFRKTWVLNGFLLLNIVWIILSWVFTSWYLLGFCLINIFVWFKINNYE